jgi:hypothetical protein
VSARIRAPRGVGRRYASGGGLLLWASAIATACTWPRRVSRRGPFSNAQTKGPGDWEDNQTLGLRFAASVWPPPRSKEPGLPSPITPRHGVVLFWGKSMATDAEIEAAVNAMRAIRTSGGEVHDDVLRAYARAALKAAELAQIAEFQSLRKRAELLADEAGQAVAGSAGADVGRDHG